MIKRVMVRAVLTVMCLFVWLPLFLMAGNSLMGEWEMLDRFGAVFGAANRPVKAALLPSYPTLKPYVELLLDSPGFYVMFWNSCLQTGLAVAGQLLVALPAAWAFGALSFKGRRGLFLIYIILMLQPFQVTMVPNYLMEAAGLDGAGSWMIFWKIGVPIGKPGIVSAMVLGVLETWNAIEQPMTFLKEQRLWPLSLYLPEITADKAAVAWAASVTAMILPVSLFVMGQGALEQGIAASGIKE